MPQQCCTSGSTLLPLFTGVHAMRWALNSGGWWQDFTKVKICKINFLFQHLALMSLCNPRPLSSLLLQPSHLCWLVALSVRKLQISLTISQKQQICISHQCHSSVCLLFFFCSSSFVCHFHINWPEQSSGWRLVSEPQHCRLSLDAPRTLSPRLQGQPMEMRQQAQRASRGRDLREAWLELPAWKTHYWTGEPASLFASLALVLLEEGRESAQCRVKYIN